LDVSNRANIISDCGIVGNRTILELKSKFVILKKKLMKYNLIILSLCIVLSFTVVSCEKDEPIIDINKEIEIPVVEEGGLEEATLQLPQVFINTNGGTIVDEPKINANMSILVNDEVDYEGAIGIEIRGSSSQAFPKKQFGFETRDAANEDEDVSILGFPEEEDWILYAPYSDKSLIRNKLMYDLSRDMGRYASKSEFVEVTINDSYNGVYLLLEKLKRDDNRIDINKLKEDENNGEDLTGGYILKIDKNSEGFTSQTAFASFYAPNDATANQQIQFVYDTPDSDDITEDQKNYISNYMASFEDALSGENFTDASLGYNTFIDTPSFIEFFLLNELSNNVDGYRISTWLVKDKNKKLAMGPIWDFNLAFGNANYCNGGASNVWAYKYNERCSDDDRQVPFWWDRLLEDPQFVAQLQTRWSTLRASTFSDSAINQRIDNYVSTLKDTKAVENNFNKWPVLGRFVWPNNYVGTSYADEEKYLKDWISDRLIWLDSEIPKL